MSLINKVVIITGAASGIGQAIALHFAKLSARLYLVDKDGGNLNKTAEQCEKLCRTKVFVAVADLTKDELVEKIVEDTKKQFGRIDAVISCIGIYKQSKILDSNVIDIYDELIATNLRSVVSITNRVAPILAEFHGNIIYISSVSATLTTSTSFVYNLSKASLTHFSKCIALELAPKGVRVNCIFPGAVKTNIIITAGLMNREESDIFYKKAESKMPLKHIVKADEIGELAAYLVSDKAKSMTGGNYTVDCGLTLFGCQDNLLE